MNLVEIIVGDITQLRVDAIVNAANATLLGGGGVDGAIHRMGGPEILDACRKIRQEHFPNGLPTGQVVVTTGGRLPARHVIHTVGPIYQQDNNPDQHLADCYHNALTLAVTIGATSIAFPGISTGVYGFPKEAAAKIALSTIQTFLQNNPGKLTRVILCAFSAGDAAILEQTQATLS